MQSETQTRTITLRIHNDRPSGLTCYLEPWGDQEKIAPNKTIDVIASGPIDDTLELEFTDHDITIYGWPGSVVTLSQEAQDACDEQAPEGFMSLRISNATPHDLVFNMDSTEPYTIDQGKTDHVSIRFASSDILKILLNNNTIHVNGLVSAQSQQKWKKFIGRRIDIEKIKTALESPDKNVVMIVGDGGLGKTALAKEVASELDKYSEDKFDSIIWLSTKQKQLELNNFFDTIKRSVGYEQPTYPSSIGGKLYIDTVLNNILSDNRYLIVIDNFESVSDPELRAYLPTMPNSSRVLATSRQKNLEACIDINLDAMLEEDAVEFIQNEGNRLQIISFDQTDESTLDKIYRITQGNPLAMKWLASLGTIDTSLDDVINSIDNETDNIFKELLSRHWSSLSNNSQNILKVIPLFAESADKQAISFVSEVIDNQIDEALEQLTKVGLLDINDEVGFNEPRYSIHTIASNYVQVHLQDQNIKKARMIDFFLNFVKKRNDWGSHIDLNQMQSEIYNIFKSMEWCDELGEPRKYIDFHKSTYNLLWTRGYWQENLKNGATAVEKATHLGDKESVAWIFMESLGWTHYCRGDYDKAREYYNRSKNYFETRQDFKGLARIYNYLGRLSSSQGQYEEAREFLNQGLRYAQDDMSITFLESHLGRVEFETGNYAQARLHFEKVIQIREKNEDEVRLCSVVCDLGDVALRLNDLDQAEILYERSLGISNRVKRLDVTARSERGLAEVKISRGKYEKALTLAQSADSVFQKLGATKESETTKEIITRIQRYLDQNHNQS